MPESLTNYLYIRKYMQDFQNHNTNVILLLLRDVLLRYSGDYQGYKKAATQLHEILRYSPAYSEYTVSLCDYFEEACKTFPTEPPFADGKKIMVFSLLCWGENYIHNLLYFCFASLLAEGNIPRLSKERNTIIAIHTDAKSAEIISRHPITDRLQSYGVRLRYFLLPDNLISTINSDPNNKYWLLGVSQTLHMIYAKRLNADLHVSAPDEIYSSEFFGTILRKVHEGAKVITQSTFRSDINKMLPLIEGYRKDGVISIDAPQLAAHALNNAHPSVERVKMNNRQSPLHWPASQQLLWEGEDTLHVICQHQHPVFISADIISRLKDRYYHTLDSELEKIVPDDCAVECPKAEDNMMMVEVSPPDQFPPQPYVDIEQYCNHFWQRTGTSKLMKFFNLETVLKIDKTIRRCPNPMSKKDIRNTQKVIRTNVEVSCPFEE